MARGPIPGSRSPLGASPASSGGGKTPADAHRLLSNGDYIASANLCRRLLKRDKRNPQLHYLLGSSLLFMGRTGEARASLQKALRLRPNDPGFHHDIALTYKREGRFEEARKELDRALRASPGDPTCLATQGDILLMLGEPQAAHDLLASPIEHSPSHPGLALTYARACQRLGRAQQGLEALERMLGEHTDQSLAQTIRAEALFRLGQLREAIGEYDSAFDAFQEGNRLKGVRITPDDFLADVDRMIDQWTSSALESLPRSNETSELPVFIVGVPRSGTSLVEQILDAHPAIHGGGELPDIGRMVGELGQSAAPQTPMVTHPAALSLSMLNERAVSHRRRLQRLAPSAARVTDKTPMNFLHLGLISLLFPNARIIHCVRDPMDTCLSCYMNNIGGNFPFAYNLEHLGVFYQAYERLMEHWRYVLNVPIIDVIYEDLIEDLEGQTRGLIEFLNLEWDDACLRYHQTGRVTLTPSNDQVRRPIYRSAVGRHQHYAHRLEPLRRALAEGA